MKHEENETRVDSSSFADIVKLWRERARVDVKRGVSKALISRKECVGLVNAGVAISECADELEMVMARPAVSSNNETEAVALLREAAHALPLCDLFYRIASWLERLDAAEACVSVCDDGDDDTRERCENCSKSIEGSVYRTSDDVSLCGECFEALWPSLSAVSPSVSAGVKSES